MGVTGRHWQQEAQPEISILQAIQPLESGPGITAAFQPSFWLTTMFGICRNDSEGFKKLGLASTIESPQYSTDQPLMVGNEVGFPWFNATYLDKAYWNRFVYNNSIKEYTLTALPYNSTIWLNGTAIQLAAPFLDVGHGCYSPSLFTGLGNCVCYKGEPVPVHYLSKTKAVCRTVPGAVWGFSAFLTRLGLYPEASWMACCAICYGAMLGFSKLLRRKLIWTTSTRRAALVFSRVAEETKGEGLDQLNEKELASRLKGLKLGYLRQSGSCQETDDNENPSAIRLVENPTHREDGLTDITNAGVQNAAQTIKSFSTLVRDHFRKRKPTRSEIYEDLNWRLYDRVRGRELPYRASPEDRQIGRALHTCDAPFSQCL